MGLATGVLFVAITAIVVVAFSAERHPASWTRTGVVDDEDDDASSR